MFVAGFAFQACSFNHSDISPCLWNQSFTGEWMSPKTRICVRNCVRPPNVLPSLTGAPPCAAGERFQYKPCCDEGATELAV